MIDLHNHILFEVDDGSKSIEESLQMLELSENIGIKSVCLTPHVSMIRSKVADYQEILNKFEALKRKSLEHGLKIEIYLGAEIDENESLLHDLSIFHTLNDSKYLLIDFSFKKVDIDELIYEIGLMGYQVIIAHPERIQYLSTIDLFYLKQLGAMFQITADHLVGSGKWKYQRKAKLLLKLGLVDIVASDAHNIQSIKNMQKAYQYVTKKYSKEMAIKLFEENPKKVLSKKI